MINCYVTCVGCCIVCACLCLYNGAYKDGVCMVTLCVQRVQMVHGYYYWLPLLVFCFLPFWVSETAWLWGKSTDLSLEKQSANCWCSVRKHRWNIFTEIRMLVYMVEQWLLIRAVQRWHCLLTVHHCLLVCALDHSLLTVDHCLLTVEHLLIVNHWFPACSLLIIDSQSADS